MFAHPKDKPETILCAAIWYKDLERKSENLHHPVNIDRGIVLCGHRHGHVIAQIGCILGKKSYELGDSEQGFLTSKNRFLDRQEAKLLFELNGGIAEYGDDLYSEDLY